MKLEQTFFVGAFDVDVEKKITNTALRAFMILDFGLH